MDVGLQILLLKVTIAPGFVGVVSLVALRYGHRAAGWLVALPINTGTIVSVLVLTEGPSFAATAAVGALLGIVSLSVFAIGYARSAVRYPWPVCLGVASAGFVASTLVLAQLPEVASLDLLAAVVSLVLVLVLLPRREDPEPSTSAPRWEIPLRMLTAALLVVGITTAADNLGPRLSGLLSPVPVFTITLAVFTHSRQGPAPVFRFMNGLQHGLFSFAAFCVVVGMLLVPYGLPIAIGLGLAAFFGVYALDRTLLSRLPSRPRGTSAADD